MTMKSVPYKVQTDFAPVSLVAQAPLSIAIGNKVGATDVKGLVRDLARRMQCPSLVIQGSRDAITGKARGIALAEESGAELVMLSGSGHGPHARDPVKVNLLLRDFMLPPRPAARWARGAARRRKRALYVSSPIGLGHAQRDAAIAD